MQEIIEQEKRRGVGHEQPHDDQRSRGEIDVARLVVGAGRVVVQGMALHQESIAPVQQEAMQGRIPYTFA